MPAVPASSVWAILGRPELVGERGVDGAHARARVEDEVVRRRAVQRERQEELAALIDTVDDRHSRLIVGRNVPRASQQSRAIANAPSSGFDDVDQNVSFTSDRSVFTGTMPQISDAYWWIVASLEKRLAPMMLKSARRDQSRGER